VSKPWNQENEDRAESERWDREKENKRHEEERQAREDKNDTKEWDREKGKDR
jgi:hypothetical protein